MKRYSQENRLSSRYHSGKTVSKQLRQQRRLHSAAQTESTSAKRENQTEFNESSRSPKETLRSFSTRYEQIRSR